VLVLSPESAALYPTKELVSILGNGQRTMEDWKIWIKDHHSILHATHVHDMQTSAKALLEMALPTTIEEDEKILAREKYLFDKVSKKGRVDQNKLDVIQASHVFISNVISYNFMNLLTKAVSLSGHSVSFSL
jgi:hypothetical protein